VWTQDVANMLHLGPLTPSLAGGTDYAWGGATTGTPVPSPVPNITQQVGTFLAAHPSGAPSSALYTISIGANDLFSILASSTNPLGDAAAAAQTEANAASALQKAGASHLVVFDVPDLGAVPQITQYGPVAEAAATALSAYYDQQLFMDLLPVELAGLKVYDLNTFTLLDNVIKTPAAYGFTDVINPCYVGPFTGGGSVCSNPNTNLFWDMVHPTARAQQIIALNAVRVAVPEPSTWTMLLAGFVALGFAGQRRKRAQAAQA
jgi:outer membrane lipase/esterase